MKLREGRTSCVRLAYDFMRKSEQAMGQWVSGLMGQWVTLFMGH